MPSTDDEPCDDLYPRFFVAALFTLTIFGVVYWRYKHLPSSVHLAKAQLEREVDPVLYRYVTDPQLHVEYEKSKMSVQTGSGWGSVVFDNAYKGQPYAELRGRRMEFRPLLFTRIYSSPLRLELILLFIMEGTYIDPGFQWLSSISLFAFNILLDFVSVTIVIVALRLLGRNTSFLTAAGTFALAICGTLMCLIVAFLSYRLFFRGNMNIFGDLVVLPMALVPPLWGVVAVVESLKRGLTLKTRSAWLGLALLAFLVSFVELWGLWSELHLVSLDLVNWRDFFSVPYVLAGTTLVPATLSVTTFWLMLVTKMMAEPARVLPEAYMTFVKEELRGTQAAYIILVLSAAVGAFVATVWPGN